MLVCVGCACVVSRFSHVQLWDSMDSSPPGSSAHGILQTRILEWVDRPLEEYQGPKGWGLGEPVCILKLPKLGCEQLLEPGEGNGNPLRYSCLENPMDGKACRLHSMVGYSLGGHRVGHD